MENNVEQKEVLKNGFFRKVWYSITKIEKYPEMSAEGIGKAFSYLLKIVAILAIVLSIWMTYQTYELINSGIDYIQNQFPEFSYKDGILQVESEEQPIVIGAQKSPLGKVIVDTNTDSEDKISEYLNSIGDSESGIIILKNRAIVKNMSIAGSISYEYKQSFEQMQIMEFNKSNLREYANGSQVISLYFAVFLTMFSYTFVMYLITTLSNVLAISIIGYLTSVILKIKMRYVAVFNMSVYSITLSVILNILYLIVNMITTFKMEYFQVMYIAVATIYLIAAIFIIKSEFIKKQAELIKIAEAQEIIKKEMENNKEEEKEEKDNKDTGKEEDKNENKDKEKDKDKGINNEPEGSNA